MEIVKLFLFFGSMICYTVGANLLMRLVREKLPNEIFRGLHPTGDVLEKLEMEFKDEPDTIKRLENGRMLELSGVLIFVLFIIVFIFF